MTAQLVPGCYVDTSRFGEAVCVEMTRWGIYIRYEAVLCSDMKTIWVHNGEPHGSYRAARPPDEASLAVPRLRGPHGED